MFAPLCLLSLFSCMTSFVIPLFMYIWCDVGVRPTTTNPTTPSTSVINMTGIWHPSSSSSTNMIDNANSAFERSSFHFLASQAVAQPTLNSPRLRPNLSLCPNLLHHCPLPPFPISTQLGGAQSVEPREILNMPLDILHRFPCRGMDHGHCDRYPAEVRTFHTHPHLSSSLTRTVSSLNCLSLLTLSTNAGPITLLCTGPGILCALTGVFVSMVYARNRHLLEFVMKDKVTVHFHFAPSCSSL